MIKKGSIARAQAAILKQQSLMTPLRFIPYVRPMVWGGRDLEKYLGKVLTSPEPYGEAWEASDHALHRSVVACGPLAGKSLRELMERERAALLGVAAGDYTIFPWLIKFLDAHDCLSVQVHPDTQAVRRLWPGEGSKTEAWFILEAAAGSRIYAGLLPGVNESRLRAALAAGTVADCLHCFEPRPGDCLPARGDSPCRWGRRVDGRGATNQRCHLPVVRLEPGRFPGQGPHAAHRRSLGQHSLGQWAGPTGASGRVHWYCGGFERRAPIIQPLVRCPFFSLDFVRAREAFSCGGTGRLQAMIVVQGQGSLEVPGPEALQVGQVWVLPAGMPRIWCRPDPGLSALLCTLPDGIGGN